MDNVTVVENVNLSLAKSFCPNAMVKNLEVPPESIVLT